MTHAWDEAADLVTPLRATRYQIFDLMWPFALMRMSTRARS
jgi:hypothetical protein